MLRLLVLELDTGVKNEIPITIVDKFFKPIKSFIPYKLINVKDIIYHPENFSPKIVQAIEEAIKSFGKCEWNKGKYCLEVYYKEPGKCLQHDPFICPFRIKE